MTPIHFYARIAKPILDFVLGLVLAAITIPIVLLLTLTSWIAFRSSPIVAINVAGKNGRRIGMLRLRSTGENSGKWQDKYGRILRAYGLDELPQIFNVVAGQMSLIGPRPLEVGTELAEWQEVRNRVRPGITGLWQVEARGDGRDMRENLHYDVQYVDQLSFVTDLRIAVRTLVTMVTKREGPPAARKTRRRRWRFPHIRLIVADMLIWVVALIAATWARHEFVWSAISWQGLGIAIGLALSIQLTWGFGSRLYRGRFRLASYEELAWVASGTVLITASLGLTTFFVSPHPVPRSALFAAGAYQLIGALGARYVARAIYAIQDRHSFHQRPERLLIFGAGEAGIKAVEAILNDPNSELLPVAYLDDEVRKHRTVLRGLKVVGGREAMGEAARRYNAETLLIAMPSATGDAISEITAAAGRLGLKPLIVPRLTKSLAGGGGVDTADIRDVLLSDFLPREEIDLDLENIASYLTDKKVLVTGAGGSIGAVLCRIIEQFEPKKLFKVDRDENALHSLQLEIEGRALLDSDDLILCDIRDSAAVNRMMFQVEPDVVFHAAALKHVTFLERHPHEAYKTNVLGTLNVLQAAADVEAGVVVNISTDKAADPVSELGKSKLIGERLTSWFGKHTETRFMSVRFGNVLGSRGSVIPTFTKQILSGETLTVTDPEATRFFMTIEEACQLVVQAGAVGGDGDVLVLDMGEPVKIVDLANRLKAQLRPNEAMDIIYTGLRPGEKLHEVLSGENEQLIEHAHRLLNRYAVPPLGPDELLGAGFNPQRPNDLPGTTAVAKRGTRRNELGG